MTRVVVENRVTFLYGHGVDNTSFYLLIVTYFADVFSLELAHLLAVDDTSQCNTCV